MCICENHVYTKLQVIMLLSFTRGQMYKKALKGFCAKIVTEFKLRMHYVVESKISAKIKVARLDLVPTKLSTPKKTMSKLLSRMNKRLLLALLVLICVSSGLGIIAGSQWASTIIGSHGNLKVDGVGVYQDANCSVALKYLDWGTVEPGSARNITLYVRNEGNHVATLFLATDNWSPVNASSYMGLSWDYGGKMLSPMENIGVILTLSVSSAVANIVDFSFDVVMGTN